MRISMSKQKKLETGKDLRMVIVLGHELAQGIDAIVAASEFGASRTSVIRVAVRRLVDAERVAGKIK